MPILDANVILRYLLNDIPEQAEESRKTILAGAATTIEVLAEVVYVLSGLYGADRTIISDTLSAFIQEIDLPNKAAVRYAFKVFRSTRLDFVDCVLVGYHHVMGMDIMTFDKKLQHCLQTDPLE